MHVHFSRCDQELRKRSVWSSVERKKVFGDCIKEFLEKGREVDNYINPHFNKNATSETKFVKRKIKILKLLLESSHV
jgi:hypothetical protein